MEWLPAVAKVLTIIICNFAFAAAPQPLVSSLAEPPANTYIIITNWIIEVPSDYKLLTIGPNDYDLAKNYVGNFIIGPVVSRKESTFNFPGGKIPARHEPLPIQTLAEPTIYAKVWGGELVEMSRASGAQEAPETRDFDNERAKNIASAVSRAIGKIKVDWTDSVGFVSSKILQHESLPWVATGDTNRYDRFSVYNKRFKSNEKKGRKVVAWAEFKFVRRTGSSCIERNRELVEVAERIRDFLVENFYTSLLCDEQYVEIVGKWEQLELVIQRPKLAKKQETERHAEKQETERQSRRKRRKTKDRETRDRPKLAKKQETETEGHSRRKRRKRQRQS